MIPDGGLPFVNGEVKCPDCGRKRPMEDLLGEYDPANDLFTVKGMQCSWCGYKSVISLQGLVRWGKQIAKGWKNPTTVKDNICPFCSRVMLQVPDGPKPSGSRVFTYLKCPESPLVYRLEVPE